jgi:glycerophosphoryl diester phosphodiesterase
MSTLVIAHRTCPRDAPENSVRGIARARAFGADLVEIDVRRARDGVPVLLHDPWLFRTTGWPVPLRWARAPWATRRRLRGGHGETVPRLVDALAALGDDLGVAIDVKDEGAMPAVVHAVQASGCADRVLLWSQHVPAVADARAFAPHIETALLRDTHDDASTRRYLEDALAVGASAVSVHESVLSRALVDDAHARGLRLYCWVQDAGRISAAASTGLDGIVTDWPAEARAVIDS